MEITQNSGLDPRTRKWPGGRAATTLSFQPYDDLIAAFRSELHYVVDVEIRGSDVIARRPSEMALRAVP